MRKQRLSIFFLALSVAVLQESSAQSITVIPTVTSADIVNATALVDPLTEEVKNIAPTSFSLNIINRSPINATTHRQDSVWVNMHIEAYVTLDEDGIRQQIVTADTRVPFAVPPSGRIFTSLDAQSGHSKDIDINSNVNAREKQILKDKISDATSGGRAPSGVYQVKIIFTVVKVGSTPTNQIVDLSNDPRFTVTVTNPTNATLIQPSDNGVEYPSPFPQFQWSYDTRAVRISVYEKRPEQQSLEDAISASNPFLQVEINRRESGNLSIFTYPQASVGGPGVNILSGPRPLERGKSYVVVLDGLRTAFGYNIDPLRTIRLFRISDPQGQLVINMLQTGLSGGAFQNFLNLIQDQNLVINSSHLTLNGVNISAQELQVILNQNKDKIKSIRFED